MNRARWRLGLELLVNLALPWLVYSWAKPWGELTALIACAIPPLVWSVGELILTRRLDALSLFVLGGIVLSMIAMLLGGSPRMLLVRESLISGMVGLLFLGTAWLKKPLLYHIARASLARQQEDGASAFENTLAREPQVLHSLRVMSLVWGGALVGEALLRSYLAWHWTPSQFLAISPFVSYGIIGLMVLWTFWYRQRLKRGKA